MLSTSNLRVMRVRDNGTIEVAFHTGDINCMSAEKQNKTLDRVKKQLAEYQAGEPDAGWKLQVRGNLADWHDWKD